MPLLWASVCHCHSLRIQVNANSKTSVCGHNLLTNEFTNMSKYPEENIHWQTQTLREDDVEINSEALLCVAESLIYN